MKNFKKMIASSLLGIFLFASIPAPKAEAGIALMIAYREPTAHEFTNGMWAGMVLLGLGSIMGNAPFIVLNSDLDRGPISNYLSKTFPLLDNASSIENLSELIIEKTQNQKFIDNRLEVRLTKSEIENALSSEDLSESDLNSIVNQLN